jgi:hypothetical protein
LRLGGREGEKQGKCDRSQTRQGHGSSEKWGWLANGWLAWGNGLESREIVVDENDC